MSSSPAEPWSWLFDGRYDGITLAFARGLTPEEFLERYGADPAAARPLPFTEVHSALRPDIGGGILRAGMLGGWAFGNESPGAQGTFPATLARLSRDTETVSLHSGANAFSMFSSWASGQRREQFEPGEAATLRGSGSHPFWDAAERHHASQPDISPMLAVLLAVEEHIGARLARETDDGSLPSVLLPQVRPVLPASVPPLVGQARPRILGRPIASLRRPPSRPY